MAKSQAMQRMGGGLPPIVIRGGNLAKRGVSAARRAAKHPAVKVTGALLAGGAYGYLEGAGHLDKVPTFGGMPASVTIAGLAYVGAKVVKHPLAKSFAFAAIAIAAFDVGKTFAQKK